MPPRTRRDPTPRTAILCAYTPELPDLAAGMGRRRERVMSGLPVHTGRVGSEPVVLALTGMSFVNAAMATQMILERFNVVCIVVCGIAGGIDPALPVGSVVAPERWVQPLEASLVRETAGGLGPDILDDGRNTPAYGAFRPHAPEVRRRTEARPERAPWFSADPALLEAAKALANTGSGNAPFEVGGVGASSPVFIDNVAYRDYLHATFAARAADMETAAIAQVAYANEVPFIGIRGVSDLAGADVGMNTAIAHAEAVSAAAAAITLRFVAGLAERR